MSILRDEKKVRDAESKGAKERVKNYNEILSAREKETQLRMEELRASLYEDEMRECTFKPQITITAEKLGGVPLLNPKGDSSDSGGCDDNETKRGE